METVKHYRAYLYTSLAREYNAGQVKNMMENFDRVAEAGGPEAAFCVAMEAYGNEDTVRACKTVKEYIANELDNLNKSHQGVNTNSKQRLARAISTLSKNIDSVGIIFNGQELTRDEIERIKPKLPLGLREPTTYSATASKKGKAVKFAIDIAI
jgi:hypothetical protein